MTETATELISIVGVRMEWNSPAVVLLCECGHSWTVPFVDLWSTIPHPVFDFRCPNQARHEAKLAARRERSLLESTDVEWPEDAAQIAEAAGLGSYGASPTAIRAALPDEVWDALMKVEEHEAALVNVRTDVTVAREDIGALIPGINGLAKLREEHQEQRGRIEQLESSAHFTRLLVFVLLLALTVDMAWRHW